MIKQPGKVVAAVPSFDLILIHFAAVFLRAPSSVNQRRRKACHSGIEGSPVDLYPLA